MNLNLGKTAGKVLALSAVATAAVSLVGTQFASAAAPTSPAGPATLLSQNGDGSIGPALTTGVQYASTTPFTIKLPASPADQCPADSASGDNLVYSYIVADGTSGGAAPGGLSVSGGTLGPIGSLDTTAGSPWQAKQTAVNTGEVINIPFFELAKGYAGDFAANQAAAQAAGDDLYGQATFDIGIACVAENSGNTVDEYWNQQIFFTPSSTDPSGFTFSLGAYSAPGGALPEAPLAVGLPLSAVAIAGASAIVLRRRRRSNAPAA